MAEPIPPADPTTGTWRLKQIGLAKLLHNLSISERTGTLVLKRGEVSKSVFFKNGYVMFAESNLATDRLGEVLCRRGEITRAQLSECLTESKRTGKMLGAVLVEKNVLRAERLLPAIEVQVREIVLGAFSWDDGEYLFSKEFFGNTEDLLDLKIRSADLILEGVRRTYTATQASKTLGDTSRPPKLSAESGYLSQELTVNFETSKVLSKIDGQRSIAQIVAETGLTELTVLQILAALAHLKILDVESTGNTGKINVNPASVPAAAPPTPAPGATDVRVRAARVEEMRAHDEVTQLLDRLPPLVSQLLFDPGAATPQVLAAAGPDADAIGRSFGNGRRILDVLQERNYTLELVRAVAHLFSAGALKPAQGGAPAAGNGWQQPAAPAGGGWQAAPGGGQPSSTWQVPGGAVPAAGGAPTAPNAGFPATKAPSPPPAPPIAAGFPATKAPEPPNAGFPATKAPAPPAPTNGSGGFGAPTGGGAWGAPVPAPVAAPVAAPVPAPADRRPSASWQKGPAIPLGGGAPAPAPATAPVAPPPPPAASQPWGKSPEPPRPAPPAPAPIAANAPIPMPSGIPTPPPAPAPAWAAPAPPPPPAGWGAPVAAAPTPVAVPPPPAAPSMPWAQPAAPAGPTAARPTGPAVWNVPSAPTPPPPTPTIAAPPPPPSAPAWGNGQPTVAPPVAAPVPVPSPAPPVPFPASPLTPPEELLEISPLDVKAVDEPATTKSKEAKEPKDKKPAPPPKTEGGGRSRRPLLAVGAVAVLAGAVVGGSYLKLIPLEIPGITPAGTPIAAVSPTPVATATPEATETAVAMVTPAETPTTDASPAATTSVAVTATVAATPTPAVTATPAPTATAVAIVATPKPSPTATKTPEDPEVKRKKAIAQVKSGNDALNAGDGAKATKFFGMAIANDPANPDAHLGLGTAYMILGDNPKAKRSFQKFLQLAPDHQYAAQTRQILGTL